MSEIYSDSETECSINEKTKYSITEDKLKQISEDKVLKQIISKGLFRVKVDLNETPFYLILREDDEGHNEEETETTFPIYEILDWIILVLCLIIFVMLLKVSIDRFK